MNKPTLAFGFSFEGDGSTTTVSINLSTGPVVYFLPSGATTPALNGSFSTSASSATGVACDGGLTVESATILLGVLTVTLSAAPTSGTVYNISGTLLF